MKIKVILTLDYGDQEFWDLDEEIEDLKLSHPIADIIIEDYTEVMEDERDG